jgi:tRNA C32,U32 (ribose-2'-O)-methylase TrmJ
MNRWMPCPDSDPDAGDKAWARDKERELEEWLKRIRMKTVLENNNTDMLMGIIEQYRGKQ